MASTIVLSLNLTIILTNNIEILINMYIIVCEPCIMYMYICISQVNHYKTTRSYCSMILHRSSYMLHRDTSSNNMLLLLLVVCQQETPTATSSVHYGR